MIGRHVCERFSSSLTDHNRLHACKSWAQHFEMEETYNVLYTHQNSTYSINDTAEMHELLQNDPIFLADYIAQNITAPELVSISENTEKENNFTWTTKSTKLFLEAYAERKEKFRDPKIKKRAIWREILQIMKQHGYMNIDEDLLDRKMRNMKRSYKTIKLNNNKKTTGRGRVSWEYYDIFEDIFHNDRTINHGSTLESPITSLSIPSSQQAMNETNLSEDSISTTDSVKNVLSPCTISPDNVFQSTIFQSHCSKASPSLSCSSNVDSEDSTSAPLKRKSVYYLKKQQIEVDKKRMDAIMVLKESIDKTNTILQEKNNLLREYLTFQTSQK